MELLTPEGWSQVFTANSQHTAHLTMQAYKMEAVILQVANTIVQGGSRIVRSVRRPFSEDEAKKAYDYLVQVHRRHGWSTPPKHQG